MKLSDLSSNDINKLFGKLEGKTPHKCDNTCKYFRFPHLEVACVLSEVFSVRKGELCYNYEEGEKGNDTNCYSI
jgi:hypothetical protein